MKFGVIYLLIHLNIVILQYINMGITKSQIHSETQNLLANLFKVMSNPARIAILEHLMKTKGCVCGDLTLEVGLAQPTISQHLKELKNAGLIKGKIDGKQICYCIDNKAWKKARKLMSTFMKKDLNQLLNCC